MAATCVAQPSNVGHGRDSRRLKIQKSMTGWAENRQFQLDSEVRNAGTYPLRIGGAWRYPVHTANSSSPPTIAARSTNSTPISRTTTPSTDIHTRVSVLVAELLYSIAHNPAAYGSLPSGYHDEDSSPSHHHYCDKSLARACIVSDVSAPPSNSAKLVHSPLTSSPARNMDFGFDWGGSGGFQTRGKQKKKAPAARFDFGDNNEENKDDTGANGAGGSDGLGGSGGGDAGGAGGGGDDNNGGGGDDDDAWGFSTAGKKGKKKTKKQLEEEEEERKRKEEEEVQADATTNTNALSWADEADGGNTNEDWTMSWGGAKTKEKKKKKTTDPPPAVPDAPSATSAFQDISLDDGAPKLDFSFDNPTDSKKPETGGSFSTWGKSWDFGSIGKEEKKEETTDFGGNNPWGFGSKTKKKTTTSSFDFGTDFGASTNNDLNFDGADDAVDTKPSDNTWGFGGVGKEKKKKAGAVEEIKEAPEPEQKEDTWGTWGTATTAKKTTKKKKNAFDDAFALTEEEPTTKGDDSFDWGFGSKDKNKDLIGEIDEKPADKQDDGDDLMSGAWGAVGKKKNNKKKTTDDVSAFLETTSNLDTKPNGDLPANDPWSTFSSKKDQKSKKGFLDDDFLVETVEPESIKEPLVAWDFGLGVKDKKKKQKAMQADGSWENRVTQEMVEAAEAKAANAEPEPELDAFATYEPELEPEPEPEPITEKVPWDHGLNAKDRRKKQKDMQLAGTWADRLTQEKIDEEKAAIEAAAAAAFQEPELELEPFEEHALEPGPEPYEDNTKVEDLVPWDHGLTTKEKKKKQKEMQLDGTWDDRLTQEIIDEKVAAAAEAKVAASSAAAALEPEAFLEPEPEAEPDQTPLEDLRAWDAGLSPKDKKKKEKQMKLDGSWENRLTQDKIDEMIAAAAVKAEKVEEPEPIAEPEVEPEPEPIEEKKPWDDGLNPKEKKRKERQMKLDGIWETRLTQEMIDEEIAAAAAKQADLETEPIIEDESMLEPESEPIEAKKPWDDGLNPKEKKRKERQMKLDGTWETRLTQEMIDEEIAAGAAKEADLEFEPIVEAEPEPEVVVEERKPWDYGLATKLEKRKREKEMKAAGTWEDRLTQEMIDAEAEAAAGAVAEPEGPPPPPVEVEPRFPWDHGLSTKDKKKKEKEMRLKGTWDDRLTQEKIDEEAAAAATAVEPEPEPEPVVEEPAGWSFGWGGSKTKPKKKPVPEPEPSPQEEKVEEGWSGNWGLGFGKDKKKTTDTTESELIPESEPEPVKEEKKDDLWGLASPSTTTASKKKKEKSAKKSDFFDPIVEEAIPDPEPVPEPPPVVEDMWAQFGKSDKTDKKTTKKTSKKTEEPPPPAPSPPGFGFSAEPEAEVADVPSVDDFNWGGLDNGRKSSKSLASEAPAKKSSSALWGFGATTSVSKTKKDKEKEAKAKKEAEEQAQKEEEERLQREAEEDEAAAKAEADRLAAEEAAKAAKKPKAGKLSKTSKTVEEKKKSGDLLDLLEEPIPTPASSSSKLKKTSTRNSLNKIEEATQEEREEATDYFSFWGATSNAKKTGGKKSPEIKKEIKTPVLTNEEGALLAELNEDEIQAILDDAPAASTSKLTKTMSNSKSARSSLSNRIDAFEDKKEKIGKTPKTSETVLINKEPEAEVALTPKELKKATKGKSSARSSKVQFETPPSPETIPIDKRKSKESVPGSFPGAFVDEEEDATLNADEVPMSELEPESESEPEPVVVKSKLKKTTKVVEKKPTKATPKKKSIVKEVAPAFGKSRDFVAEPGQMDELDLLDGPPPKLPTPPLDEESVSAKPTKKERARVERSATGSWALWGSQPTPKKPVRSKTVDDVSPPSSRKAKSPPVMVKPKGVKTSKKEDMDESRNTEPLSKTSGSDKDSSSKPSDKSKPSRAINFTNLVLGAPPSAMRTGNLVRRNSTTTSKVGPTTPSRRQSVDYNGILSPPPEESPVARKAAALMGYAVGKPSRRSSVKGKTNSYPDPYPIDDDDVVMVNPRAKELEPTSKSKPKNRVITEAKRSSTKPRSKTISGDEDVVMVDSPMAMESDHERSFERPQLQRSNTSRSSKSFFGIGSFFNNGVRTPVERPRSAQVTDNEETTPRVRSRNHSRKRSRVTSPADGFTTDAHGETDADAARRRARRTAKEKKAEDEERQAREERRRERREREKADLEARQQRAREQARKEREAEEQRREEKRARRREREAAEQARIAQEEAEAEAAAERRKEERRRLREKLEAEAAMNTLGRDERRRTYGGEEEVGRAGKAERTSRTKPMSGRRSTALMAEYHESRNGSGRGIKPPADKTSSWIDSQQDEPPELPPFEGTVLDDSGQRPRPVDDPDPRRRRKDKYAGMTEVEIAMHRAKRGERRERRIVEKSTSGGSDEKQGAPVRESSKRQSRVYEDYDYAEPVRTFDGRPQQTRRNSLFGKFF